MLRLAKRLNRFQGAVDLLSSYAKDQEYNVPSGAWSMAHDCPQTPGGVAYTAYYLSPQSTPPTQGGYGCIFGQALNESTVDAAYATIMMVWHGAPGSDSNLGPFDKYGYSRFNNRRTYWRPYDPNTHWAAPQPFPTVVPGRGFIPFQWPKEWPHGPQAPSIPLPWRLDPINDPVFDPLGPIAPTPVPVPIPWIPRRRDNPDAPDRERRETGPKTPPRPRDRPNPRPRDRPRTNPDPHTPVVPGTPTVPGTNPQPRDNPATVVVVGGRDGRTGSTREPTVSRESRPHLRSQPGRREKETKVRPANMGALGLVSDALNAVTEAGDLIDAIFGALPDSIQDKYKKGGILGKTRGIAENWNSIDINKAIGNIVANHLEDKVIGAGHKAVKDNLPGRGSDMPISPGFGPAI